MPPAAAGPARSIDSQEPWTRAVVYNANRLGVDLVVTGDPIDVRRADVAPLAPLPQLHHPHGRHDPRPLPRGRVLAPRVRAFLQFLKEHFPALDPEVVPRSGTDRA